jgi:hypothetical protein
MAGKTLIQIQNPVTQSLAAIKALLQWKGRSSDPLPQFVELGKRESRVVLVLSNKKDSYYTTTAKACSCPSATWHPSHQCKHQRKYFPEVKAAAKATDSEPLVKRGGFRPVDTLPEEERAAKASSLSAIDCHDTTDKEAAYWSIKEDRDLWPAEA